MTAFWKKHQIGIVSGFLCLLLAIMMMAPVLFSFSTSIKSELEIMISDFSLLPEEPTFENYRELFSNSYSASYPIMRWFLNSLVVAVAQTILTVIVTSLAAYGYARLSFPGKNGLFGFLMATMTFPAVINIIPLYKICQVLGIVDSPLALILPGVAGVFNVFLIRQFMASIPRDMDEAAMIDGANRFQIYYRIILPLCVPVLMVVAMFAFTGAWNDYVYSRQSALRLTDEWAQIVQRDYNHPCIVCWVPLNESWGVDGIMNNPEEQSFSQSLYYLTKALDQTRPVISNDGWNHTKSDMLTIHDYDYDRGRLKERYSSLEKVLPSAPGHRTLYAQGSAYGGEPLIVSEFGGIAFRLGKTEKGWGYSEAESEEDFLRRYENVVGTLLESQLVQGFVYTQLCDVEQEINGLMTYDRRFKAPPEKIRAINCPHEPKEEESP